MEEKKWWQSKTLWVNFIGLIVMLFPPAKEVLTPEVTAAIFTVANVVLRLVTKSEIKLIK